MSGGLEITDIRIGFLPLADCAPIIMAKERRLFQKFGLNVTLVKVNSWARMRDMLAVGDIQGAHMLAPMVLASAMGLEPGTPPFTTALALNMNGNAITVSNALYAAMYDANPDAMRERPITARALRDVVNARSQAGQPAQSYGIYAIRYY